MQKALCLKYSKPTSNPTHTKPESANNRFFEIMYIRNDIDQSVEVYEGTVLDFNSIIENLNDGNSIFITQKSPIKKSGHNKIQEQRNYINHI